MKQVLLLVMVLITILTGCENSNESKDKIASLLNETEGLKSENNKLQAQLSVQESQRSDLESQIKDQTKVNQDLKSQIEQFGAATKGLALQEYEITFDMRIPLDVFEVIQTYFVALNEKDTKKLKQVTGQQQYEIRSEYLDSDRYKQMNIKKLTYTFERTFKSTTKVTKTMLIGVEYDEYSNTFALQNTNDEGWIIVDID